MFFFPRKTFSKEIVMKQGMKTLEEKKPEDQQAVEKIQNDLLKDFHWDPTNLITAGLESIQQGLGQPHGLGDMAQSSCMTPTSSLGPPFSLTPSQGALYLYLYLPLGSQLEVKNLPEEVQEAIEKIET